MVADYASSVQAVALRVTRLGADGAPLVGTKNAYATSQFTRFSVTPEYETGEEVKEKAADGTTCVYFKMPDTLTKVNFQIAICKPQPEIYDMLGDGTLLMDGTDVAGWAAPAEGTEANPDGLGIEVWTRAIVNGRPAATNPFWRWVFPFAKTRLDGERVFENGMVANAFAGEGYSNALFGDGPVGDWDFPTTSAMQFARDASAPTGINDYVAVVADTP